MPAILTDDISAGT